MIILDDFYVSKRMVRYLEESGQAVLESEMSKQIRDQGAKLNIVPESEAITRVNAGERLYAMSESHFDWVKQHITRQNILHGLNLCKDKELMRRTLAPLYPDYYFESVDAKELLSMSYPGQHAPFVLKPSVGFLSLGVYLIHNETEWNQALEDIRENQTHWAQWYDASVVQSQRFILESLIEGTEYALDAYFDDEGKPHLLNILRHDFANDQDASDRLYYCSRAIMEEKREIMFDFLQKSNELAGMRDFPVHAEVRECKGQIIPVEFNAMRFAGLGSTEISNMAFGFFTFDQYLAGSEPDWQQCFEHSGNELYCLSALNPPSGTPAGTRMDYERFWSKWQQPIDIDHFDYDATGTFGFFFWKTDPNDDTERRAMLEDDLSEYLQIG